jgi:NTE family protein
MYGDAKLSELPMAGPQFTFCATNLQTGRLVHLTRGAIVDYRIGRTNVDVSLARAVAASSAFPPFLSPVIIDCKNANWTALTYSTLTQDKRFTEKLYLTDGGAYDNMGLEPIWDDYETVLVSDAGAPYQPEDEVDSNWFSQLHCAFEIATDQARGVSKRWLVSQFQAGAPAGTYWGINTDIRKYELGDAIRVAPGTIGKLSAMRTRLNAFSPEEQELLINWGYAVTDAALRRWCVPLCTASVIAALPYPARPLA